MSNITIIQLILLFNIIFISSTYAYCNKETSNWDLKLKNDLLCQYEKELRPPSNQTTVALKYVLVYFDYDDMSYVLNLQSIISHKWNDTRLMWDPKNYDGIERISVSPDYLWTPKLFLNDSHYHYGLGSCHPIDCILRNEGQVSCGFPCHQSADCIGDFTDWPFDTHNCSVVFKTFLSYENVIFDSEKLKGARIIEANKRWKILKAIATVNETFKENINFKFVITRLSEPIFGHALTPSYILVVLNLVIFFLQPGSYQRTIICGVNIYLHFGLMDRVWWQLPTIGLNVPRFLKNMSLMLILTTFAFIETILMKFILDVITAPPLWIKSFSDFLESNFLTKYFVMTFFDDVKKMLVKDLENDIDEKVGEEVKKNEWTTFFHFVDRIFFLLIFVIYMFTKQ